MTGWIPPSLPLSFQKLLESLVPWLSPFHMHRTQGRRPDLNLICEISPSRTCTVPKCCHPALQPLCSSDSPLHSSLARPLPPPAHCQCQVTTAPGSPLTTLPQLALQKLLPLVFTIQVWAWKNTGTTRLYFLLCGYGIKQPRLLTREINWWTADFYISTFTSWPTIMCFQIYNHNSLKKTISAPSKVL